MIDLIHNFFLWKKYSHMTFNGNLIQTTLEGQESKSKSLRFNNSGIKARNHVMLKPMKKFSDYHPSFFYRFVARKKVVVPILESLFGEYFIKEQLIKNPDFTIFDHNTRIYMYEVVKDLALIEYDKKTVLVYFGNRENINKYEIGSYIRSPESVKGFIIFDLAIMNLLDEELKLYLGQDSDYTNPTLVLEKFTRLFFKKQKALDIQDESHKDYIKLFETNNIDKLQVIDFTKYLYFNADQKFKNCSINNKTDLFNIAYSGGTGSGKTYHLLNNLGQDLAGRDYKRIIFFDTQNSFENNFKNNVNPIYSNRFNYFEENKSYFKIDENNIVLNPEDYANVVTYLIENIGYSNEEKKAGLLEGIDYEGDRELFIELLEEKIQEITDKKTLLKSITMLEDLKKVLNFARKVQIGHTTIFEDVEQMKQYFCVLHFEDYYFYEACAYLWLSKFDKMLNTSDDFRTILYCDELQEYTKSPVVKELLLHLTKVKRQKGFRIRYTALSYQDVSFLYPYTQHIFFSSLNDVWLENEMRKLGEKEKILLTETMKRKVDKIVFSTQENKISKLQLNLPLVQ